MASTYQTVRYGSTGSAVRQLQSALNQKGYQLSEDGIFGAKTRAAVRDYQKKNGLLLDGIAGSQTWNHLMSAAAAPERGRRRAVRCSRAFRTRRQRGWRSWRRGTRRRAT